MTTTIPPLRPVLLARRGLAVALLAGAVVPAIAQYKIVAPDGRVTYTDKPPTAAQARQGGGSADTAPAANAGMPYETRQAMSRYPVTLYAGKGCAPCDQARQWLRGRGIPYNEYTVDSNADIAQLQQRFGDSSVPVVTIGNQTIKGFSGSELQSYADAAGYPKQARLTGYNWPAPRALVPVGSTAPEVSTSAAPSAAPKIDLPPPSKSGIQF